MMKWFYHLIVVFVMFSLLTIDYTILLFSIESGRGFYYWNQFVNKTQYQKE